METIMTLGESIRNVRRAKNLTLQAVGEAVGTPYQNVQKWEKDKSVPSTTQLVALAKVLGVNVSELLGEDLVMGDISGILPYNTATTTQLPLLTVANQTLLLTYYKDNDSIKALKDTFPVAVGQVSSETHVVIEIGTDIMEPRLMNGFKVLAELVRPEDYHTEHGGIYAVMYGRKFVVRRIVNNDIAAHGKLFLTADNTKYDPIPVDANSIRAMWKILRVVDAPIY